MLVVKLIQQLCPDKIPVAINNKIGEGADGEVYEVRDNPEQVIKFCILYQTGRKTVDSIYKKISNVLDVLSNPTPAFATVYSYGLVGEFKRQVAWTNHPQPYLIYYYIMEKLNKITEDEEKVFHSILSHKDRGIHKNYSDDKIKEMLLGMKTALDFDEKKITFFCDNIKNSPVSHMDIHERNIMKDSFGNFKFVDFDRAQIVGEKNVKERRCQG